MNFVSIKDTPELRAISEECGDSLMAICQDLAIECVERHGIDRDNACMLVLSAQGQSTVNIMHNLALTLGVEWDPEPFSEALQTLLQKESLGLALKASGETN